MELKELYIENIDSNEVIIAEYCIEFEIQMYICPNCYEYLENSICHKCGRFYHI